MRSSLCCCRVSWQAAVRVDQRQAAGAEERVRARAGGEDAGMAGIWYRAGDVFVIVMCGRDCVVCC